MEHPTIRCSAAMDAPPSFVLTWELSKWISVDEPGDYASDITLFGMPEFLGTSANLLGMVLIWMLIRTQESVEYNTSARRCFQWMMVYMLMHAAVHMSWGYRFRAPFTIAMNIAYVWMRHHGFSVAWLQASSQKQEKGRHISEACAYLLIVANLVLLAPRGVTVGITAFVQPLVLWPLTFGVNGWRRPTHLRWLAGFSVMWWTFSYFIKREVQVGSACTWLSTHLTAEIFGVAGNLCLVVYILKVMKDCVGKSEEDLKRQ